MTNQLTCRNGEIGKLTSRDVTFNRRFPIFARQMGKIHRYSHQSLVPMSLQENFLKRLLLG